VTDVLLQAVKVIAIDRTPRALTASPVLARTADAGGQSDRRAEARARRGTSVRSASSLASLEENHDLGRVSTVSLNDLRYIPIMAALARCRLRQTVDGSSTCDGCETLRAGSFAARLPRLSRGGLPTNNVEVDRGNHGQQL
jgi:hypothetical protein